MKLTSQLHDALLEYRAKVTDLERENGELWKCLHAAYYIINRYHNETPIGNQPHMIVLKAEEWIERAEALVANKGGAK